MKAINIAELVHETNRTYCRLTGDDSQLPWAEAPEWQRASAVLGVEGILSGDITTPEDSHISWLREKERTGWTYGPVKDVEKKEHPCYVPYSELPAAQQIKDALFFGIVRAFKEESNGERVFSGPVGLPRSRSESGGADRSVGV